MGVLKVGDTLGGRVESVSAVSLLLRAYYERLRERT
jgi:hypothetical protein